MHPHGTRMSFLCEMTQASHTHTHTHFNYVKVCPLPDLVYIFQLLDIFYGFLYKTVNGLFIWAFLMILYVAALVDVTYFIN